MVENEKDEVVPVAIVAQMSYGSTIPLIRNFSQQSQVSKKFQVSELVKMSFRLGVEKSDFRKNKNINVKTKLSHNAKRKVIQETTV